MLKQFKLFQNLTDLVTRAQVSDPVAVTESDEADFWSVAEPAGGEPEPLKRNVLQWRRVISSVREPLVVFPGQPVDLLGFVYRTPQDAAAQFTLARQVIRCCLADTVPLGLTVVTADADQFETHCWLHVQGVFTVATNGNRQVLAIAPTQIERIDPPQKCYINGVF